ncbi:MAG: hypothetical protein GTO63_30305 [Anaerolineae bacterium]|nr:hypothetical protein [Anaerolineae bacterium]NIN98998.1 hypothetical protein [Anaerolineae bacterium]
MAGEIRRLDREREGREGIALLEILHPRLTVWAAHLRDSGRTVTVRTVAEHRTQLVAWRDQLQTYKDAYGTWFQTRYGDGDEPSAANTGITGLQNIIDEIDSLKPNYPSEDPWADSTPVDQNHRNQIATAIETALEA